MRLDAPQAHQLLQRYAQLVAHGAKVLFYQARVEAIVPGGDRCVRGEDAPLRHFAQGVVKAEAVFVHPLADCFQRGEGAVTLVEVVDSRRDSQCPQRPHAPHAQYQFLANPGAMVAAV